jgi:hypothetical protein
VKRLPTDFEILNTIYERYYDEFPSFVRSEPTRSAKIMVPLDVRDLATDMGVDPVMCQNSIELYAARR